MADSTSIDNLPTDPTGGGSVGGNINLIATEQPSGTQSVSLDQNTINQLISGLQQASVSGATSLPTRDIPMNTQQLTNDPNIQQNYIPESTKVDYINNYESTHDLIDKYTNKNDSSADKLYDEIQVPLLLAVAYFIFQLPIFKQMIFKYFSFMCNKDGNYNFNGYVLTSVFFGAFYYLVVKFITHFSRF
jgi:hypothetical protein